MPLTYYVGAEASASTGNAPPGFYRDQARAYRNRRHDKTLEKSGVSSQDVCRPLSELHPVSTLYH